MRILLTGSTGFLGRHVLESPAAVGVQFSCMTRAIEKLSEREIPAGPAVWGRAEFEDALASSRPDVVIHCAGATHADGPRHFFEANTLPAAGLLAAVSGMATPPRVILLGSAAEYGFVGADAMPVREDYPCQPRSEYGISKLSQTLLGMAAAERGLPVITARLFNPVGLGMPPKLALPSFARRIVRASESGGVIRVGNIEVQRDFIDVAEAARILLGLAGAAEWPWSLVNLCSGKAFRLEALLQAMIRSSGRRVRLQVDPALLRPQDMPLLVGNTERLGALGLFPEEPDFETLIPQLIAEPHSHIRNSS